MSFCERDANRAIFGSIELTGTTGCVSVPVKIPKLTFGAVLYVVTGGSESVLKSIGPAAGVGIKDATLLLEASGASFVRITASGSPFIWGVKGPVGSFIQHAGSNVVLEMSAAYYFAGKTVTRFSIGAKPIKISNTLRMSNVAGTMGPSAFSEVLTATVPAASQVAKVGIEIPMIVCVEDCKMSKPKELFFSGKLYFSPPEQTRLNGDIAMVGWWNNVLKAPFAHAFSIRLGIGIEMAAGFAPTRLEIAAGACLGSKYACYAKSGNYVLGGMFVGIDRNDASKNYFMGMVSSVTFGQLFSIFGDTLSPLFYGWAKLMPTAIASAGIGPFMPEKCTSKAGPDGSLSNLNCYAYISANPSGIPISVPITKRTSITIPRGFKLSGRVKILNAWAGLKQLSLKPSLK